MAKSVAVNTYYGGINRDTSKHVEQNTNMYDCENFRIMTQDGESTAALENVKGNIELDTLNNDQLQVDSGWEIIGHCVIREDIVLFAVDSTTTPTASKIYIYKYDSSNNGYKDRITLYNDSSNDLNLGSKITCVGRYETQYSIKVYWRDDDNSLRYMNIAPDIDNTTGLPKDPFLSTSYASLQGQTIEEFDILQKFDLVEPEFVEYTSGELYSGMVQYAYRLYNLYGSETNFSPISEPIPLSVYVTQSTLQKVSGDEPDVLTGLGVKGTISLSGYSMNFDKIEIVSIWYNNINGVPSINIVDLQDIPDASTATITFVDNGIYTYGSIDLSELLLIKNDFTVKTMDTKDDRLFVGNISETYFDLDYDARAYRFRADGTCRVINSGSEEQIIKSGSNFTIGGSPIGETEDCINPYNYLSNDGDSTKEYRFLSNGVSEGGEGPNISYTFLVKNYTIDDNSSDLGFTLSLNGYSNLDWLTGRKKGFQKDEIYRFGIVWIDNKGRNSFVKWIGDIRMPSVHNGNLISQRQGGGEINAYSTYVKFTVNPATIPTNDDGTSMDYQFVYVKRTRSDRTVIAQGLVTGCRNTTHGYRWVDHNITYEVPTSGGPESPLGVLFYSADTDYNDLDLNGNLMLYRDGSYTLESYTSNSNSTATYITKLDTTVSRTREIINIDEIGSTLYSDYYYEEAITPFGSAEFSDVVDTNSSFGLTESGKVTQSIFILLNSAIAADADEAVLAYLRRDIQGYGGYTYTDRSTNQYIPASDISSGNAYYGDTHISMYDRFHTTVMLNVSGTDITDSADREGYTRTIVFANESSIVLPLRHEDNYNKLRGLYYSYLMKPNDNIQRETITLDWSDLYLYNPVYSRGKSTKVFFSKPLDWRKTIDFDTRIRYSDLKINGEERDSWLQFRPNNFAQVDARYGTLNRLVTFRDELFCFQESGISIAPVNQQVLETSDIGVATVLGEGAVLTDQFNYNLGSTEIGIQGDNEVILSPSAMYWIDRNKKKIYQFSGTVNSLSELTGLSGYTRNTITNSTTSVGTYDNEYSEVLICFENNKTLVYNELLSAFQSWYTFNTDRFIKTSRDTISVYDSNNLWRHNYGERAEWYGTIYSSLLEVIINGDGSTMKEFNNFEFMSELASEAFGIWTDIGSTWTDVRVLNDYLTSQVITFVPYQPGYTIYTGGLPAALPAGVANIRRRLRKWRTVVPRVAAGNPYMDNYRFRDAYLKARFRYNNANGYRFRMHNLNTYYALSEIE